MHTVLNAYNVLGGPTTIVVMATTEDFYKHNPKTYKAVVNALKEAVAFINNHKRAAAEIYLKVSKDKRDSLEDIYNIINSHDVKYSYAPHNSMQFVDFMYKRGLIKVKPESWRDLYFPNVWSVPGAN